MFNKNLWISAMFVNQRDNSDDVLLFDHVEGLRGVNENTVKNIKNT